MMKTIASPLGQIKGHYTVVVVGSGYGAGVAASRMARAGVSVCVLERGREILPGAYPDTLAGVQAELQIDTAEGRIGDEQGLYNLHVNPDMLALVGAGLGGTSLINANVVLEMDKRLFLSADWPEPFRQDPDLLAPYAERARAMLDPSPYPSEFPPLNKLGALQASAQAMRQPFYRPPIAVNFVDQKNPFGVVQPKCTLCGDCTSGCNVGAKNTTLMNYLPDAHAHGAELFTGAR
ncbi:GMC family oxidoreductase N-terminal domain-containing protein, partial [Ideonella sp.]|uniref:GMC family oxidoreductase N-terminal domain-containing protein n=1 Tax=Ideonella sp. TaxID=1929293 RepID=UPI002B4A6609